jgi:hypothetical protein
MILSRKSVTVVVSGFFLIVVDNTHVSKFSAENYKFGTAKNLKPCLIIYFSEIFTNIEFTEVLNNY